MEVTCERCKAEYDFDESLVGEAGTSVKCTDCGHVFKVYPPGGATSRGRLQIRFRDGHVELLSSLRELQRRARAGEITLEDEIGREGFEWRPLRDVQELRGFFQPSSASGPLPTSRRPPPGTLPVSATSARPGAAPSSQAPTAGAPSPRPNHTMLGVGPAPRTPAAAAPAQRDPARAASGPAASAAPPGARPPSTSPPSARPSSPRPAGARPISSTPSPAPYRPPAAAAPVATSAPQPTPSQRANLYLDDEDAADVPGMRRSTGGGSLRWIGLGVLIAGGAWFAVNALTGASRSDAPAVTAAEPGAATAQDAGGAGEETDGAAELAAAAGAEVETQPLEKAGAADQQQTGETDDRAGRRARPQPEPARAAAPRAERPSRRSAQRADDRREAQRADDRREAQRRERRGAAEDEHQSYGELVRSGDRLLRRKQYARAQHLFEQALEQRGKGSEANSGLGFALLGQGQPRKALPHLETAARSGFADAHVGLGDALAKLGRQGQAVEAYEAYLKRMPSGGRAGYARSRIKALSARRDEPPSKKRAPAGDEAEPPQEESQPTAEAPGPGAAGDEAPADEAPAEETPQPDDGDEYVPAGAITEEGF